MNCLAEMLEIIVDADNSAASAYYQALTRVGVPDAAIEHARLRSDDYGSLVGQFAVAALSGGCSCSNSGVLVLDQDLQNMLNDMFPEDNRETDTWDSEGGAPAPAQDGD